jgi:protein SCO1
MKLNMMLSKNLLLAATLAGALSTVPARAHEGEKHGIFKSAGSDEKSPKHHSNHIGAPASANYVRSLRAFVIPDVTLLNADARPVRLHNLLAGRGAVMLDFISTNCTAVCPELSRAFSGASKKLSFENATIRMISVSMDPERDTPARLKAYAKRFGAGANWQFLTGDREAIISIRRAFDNYQERVSGAEPLTFLRPAPGQSWVRIYGIASPEELLREYHSALQQ